MARDWMQLANPVGRVRDEAARAVRLANMAVRVGVRSGLLKHTNARSFATLVRAIVRNQANPSALYRFQAQVQPHKLAVCWRDQRLTFEQLDQQIDSICAGLHARGLQRGQRAVFMLKNCPAFVALQPAMSRMGTAGVSISWRSTPDELTYLLQHSQAKALFFDHELAPVVRQAMGKVRIAPHRVFAVGGAADGFDTFERLIATGGSPPAETGDEAAVIIYTSGTTGRPKGAVRKFPRDVVLGTLAIMASSPLRSDDIHLAVLPFYHSTAFAFTSFSHLLGATVVILDGFTPGGFLQAIERERITQTAVVPTLLHRVLQLGADTIHRYDTRSLRAIITCGAPLSARLAAEVMDTFGNVLFNYYGATETGLNTVATPEDLRLAPGTIGRVMPENEIRLLDESGRDVPRGQVGELFVRGPMMVAGYDRDERATQASLRDGYFSVGDLGWLDDRGCYHLAGRKRDMIISGGVNVYPAEVEAVLESHPDVADVAVVGVHDEEWGERVRAVLVLCSGDSEQAIPSIEEHCRQRLAGPKRPREYVVTDMLPRNPTGKVLKDRLRQ